MIPEDIKIAFKETISSLWKLILIMVATGALAYIWANYLR